MASKSKELSDLQRDLLHVALQGPKAKIWLPKASQQTFPTTYAAIVSLQRRGLLDSDQVKDPEILSWKVTREGREALKTPKPEPALRKQDPAPEPSRSSTKPAAAPPAVKPVAAAPAAKGSAKATVAASRSKAAPPAKVAVKTTGKIAGKTTVSAARSAPAPEAPRERGGKGQKAVPAASPGRSIGKKAATAAKKSGGRGRT